MFLVLLTVAALLTTRVLLSAKICHSIAVPEAASNRLKLTTKVEYLYFWLVVFCRYLRNLRISNSSSSLSGRVREPQFLRGESRSFRFCETPINRFKVDITCIYFDYFNAVWLINVMCCTRSNSLLVRILFTITHTQTPTHTHTRAL